MESRLLLDHELLNHTLDRLAFQVYEQHLDVNNFAIIALQPRGVFLGRRMVERLKRIYNVGTINYGELDITFHRDDFRRRTEMLVPSKTNSILALKVGIYSSWMMSSTRGEPFGLDWTLCWILAVLLT